jgi:hypothetical protein
MTKKHTHKEDEYTMIEVEDKVHQEAAVIRDESIVFSSQKSWPTLGKRTGMFKTR